MFWQRCDSLFVLFFSWKGKGTLATTSSTSSSSTARPKRWPSSLPTASNLNLHVGGGCCCKSAMAGVVLTILYVLGLFRYLRLGHLFARRRLVPFSHLFRRVGAAFRPVFAVASHLPQSVGFPRIPPRQAYVVCCTHLKQTTRHLLRARTNC